MSDAMKESSYGSGAAQVRLVGRMDLRDGKGPRFAWSGSGIIARFSGTELHVRFSSGQYTVLVDGVLQPKLVASGALQSVARGLPPGIHCVEVYRRTEANLGEAQFLGLEVGGGELLPPPPPPERRIEIVGDSISCGYGNEGADESYPFSADTENHYLSYGAIACRNVGAELITVAWSGKGLVRNYGEDLERGSDPLPTYYERALPERADSQWDFSKWQADAVVINLGTNDFSTEGGPSRERFEAAYFALIRTIRGKYPKAWVLCTNGPVLEGPELSRVRLYIRSVVDSVRAAGDLKVTAFELTPQAAADGYGCDWHPSQATHRKLAAQLTAVLESTLGW
jgi:lysophospholipase L1-like esterase